MMMPGINYIEIANPFISRQNNLFPNKAGVRLFMELTALPESKSIGSENFVNSRQNSFFHYKTGSRFINKLGAMPGFNSIEIKTSVKSRRNSCLYYIAGYPLPANYL